MIFFINLELKTTKTIKICSNRSNRISDIFSFFSHPPKIFAVGSGRHIIFGVHLSYQWSKPGTSRNVTGTPNSHHLKQSIRKHFIKKEKMNKSKKKQKVIYLLLIFLIQVFTVLANGKRFQKCIVILHPFIVTIYIHRFT